jgi:bifunctional non-homologous end joining protein LigD
MTAEPSLPAFIEPMLAIRGQPFDSDDYLFEIKWDGIRMLVFIEEGRYRLLNRHGVNTTERYPEFAFLAGLPPGTILDGEMVVFRNGKPDLGLVQGRDKTRSALKIRSRSLAQPATYLVFDLLYQRGQSLLQKPLLQRRQRLEEVVSRLSDPPLVLSQGMIGAGRALFQETYRQHLEGIMAKKLTSTYRPGQRAAGWIKIKHHGHDHP